MIEINQLLQKTSNKKLLVIFPHPDDETVMTSGLILSAVKFGFQVKIVCVTNGTLGQVHIHGRGRSVVQIRREELSRALDILGVTDREFWPYCDGRLSQELSWQERVLSLISDFIPEMLVTYGPSGVSGHPDHLALGKFIFEVCQKHHKSVQLLWPAFAGSTRTQLASKVNTADRLEVPEYQLKLDAIATRTKRLALKAHRSQNLSHPLDWLKQDASEYFAQADYNQKYNFKMVPFDLGD